MVQREEKAGIEGEKKMNVSSGLVSRFVNWMFTLDAKEFGVHTGTYVYLHYTYTFVFKTEKNTFYKRVTSILNFCAFLFKS